MTNSNILLSVKDLCIKATIYPQQGKPFKKDIVKDVSFDLERGKVIGLIGESGAGKSTIGLATMGYCRRSIYIDSGQIYFDGKDIITLPKNDVNQIRGKNICYVAQSAAASFNPAHRLMDQIIETSLLHGVFEFKEAKERAIELFALLDLPDPQNFGNRFPHQVSGGQLQRAMTAMALCSKPSLIIFDEPTTALDVTTQIDVLAAIKNAIEVTNTAAIYITHDLAVVAQISDDIMVLRYGKMVEYASTDIIINTPTQEYTSALVSVSSKIKKQAEDQTNALLEVKNVTASYSNAVKVLDDVSFFVPKGQTLAIVGESGSGKSTTARVITGLLNPEMGSIFFDGVELKPDFKNRSKEDLRNVQMIFQMADVAMNPRHKIGEIIGRPLQFYFDIAGEEKKNRVLELLDLIELPSSYYDYYPAELSGGQKQRVCIARALAADPKFIICDEPTSALDPLVVQEILNLLMDIQKKRDVSYLFITHDIATVRAIADSIAVMYKGKIVRFGPKDTVLAPPFDDYTDLLLKSVPEKKLGWLEEVIASLKMRSAGN